jgi:hypothetical protein
MLIFVSDFFLDEMRRGAEVADSSLMTYIPVDKKIESSEIKEIDKNAFYIISNFTQLSEEAKTELIKNKNYLIYEHDHKYTPTRNPYLNPDGSINPDGVVLTKFLINADFYKNAKVVLCQTAWHQEQLQKNLVCNLDNIHGSFYTTEDLNHLETALKYSKKKDKYAIFSDSETLYLTNGMIYKQGSNIKNKNGAIKYCIENRFSYIFIPRINNKIKFWETLASFKHFVFFPDIPETCSRLLIETKMLGMDVITNENSGASHEGWFKLQGQELITYFKDVLVPEAIEKFKRYL